MDTADLLRQLVEARGPSGYEAELRGIASERLGEFADETRVDALGNVIALKRGEGDGPRPSLMLAGHMDEIALIVSGLEKGFLRVTRIGGWDPRVLFGQRVTVHGRRELPGMVVSVPPHFTAPSEREKPVSLDKLFVDVGLPVDEVERHVRVGDVITLRTRMLRLNGAYAACKAMDDRAAVAAIVLCLEELSRRRHSWDVYAVATAQEETGCIGAGVGAFGIEPTAAVAIDVTFGQQPGVYRPRDLQDGRRSVHRPRAEHPPGHVRPARGGGTGSGAAVSRRARARQLAEPTPGRSRWRDRASPRGCSASPSAPCTPPWKRFPCATSSARRASSPSSSCDSTRRSPAPWW